MTVTIPEWLALTLGVILLASAILRDVLNHSNRKLEALKEENELKRKKLDLALEKLRTDLIHSMFEAVTEDEDDDETES